MKHFLTRLRQAVLPNLTSTKVWFSRCNLNMRAVLLIWSFLVLCLGLLLILPGMVMAQESTWNPPIQLHSTENKVYDPILLSDDSGRLHLFWSEVTEEMGETAVQSQIYYMVKDGDSWSGPVDVLTIPIGFTNGLRGSVDDYGRPYLVIGGNNSILQYSRALHPEALTALAWQPLRGLTGLQVGGEISVADGIHVIYCDTESQIHYLRLGENGNVESSHVIAWLPGNQLLIRPPRMIQGADGTLHVILPAITPPAGDLDAYYIRSTDQGETWSELKSISQPDLLAIAIAESSNGNLNILYIGRAGVGGRYHSISEDGGDSWSEPMPISLPSEGSGMSGGDYALDSANRLHAVIGLANDATVAHSEFNGTNWSDIKEISQGVSGHLENMETEITEGNRLHAVWQNDHNSIWYVEGITTAPLVESKGIILESNPDLPSVASFDELAVEQVPALPSAPESLPRSALQQQPTEVSSAISLSIAAAVSTLFIGFVIVVRYLLNKR